MKKAKRVDLSRLDGWQLEQLATIETNKLVSGKPCSICGQLLIKQTEINEAICSNKDPFTVAHKQCWEDRNDA